MKKFEDVDKKIVSHEVAPDDDLKLFSLRNFGRLALFLLGMIAFVLFLGALLSGFFLPGNSLRINQSPTLLPPEPRLQVNPAQDFQTFYATQQAELNTYGWNDRENGTVHIPVERAMQLLAQTGLPVMTGTPTPPAPGSP
jgi:hypothetical protein